MKKMKILGLIALVMVVGFAMVACDDTEGCDHEWGDWEVINATLALEGERSRVCEVEGCGEEDFEKIPRWTALFNTTWRNGEGAGSQYLKITENAFQINVTAPQGNVSPDKFDFEIATWAYADASTGHGLTGDVTAFQVTGTTKENTGALDDETGFKINVTVSKSHVKIDWGSTGVSGQTFTPFAAW